MTAVPNHKRIIDLVREGDSDFASGDPWGTNMGVLFAIAETVYAFTGEIFPGFNPSPLLKPLGGVAQLDMDQYETREVASDYMDGGVSIDDLRTAYTILSRYDDMLRAAGRNY